MQKHFPADVIAGLYTGMSLTNFSDIHSAAEHLMGHPIWTHEFADRRLWEKMKEKLSELFPDIGESEKLVEGCSPMNFAEKAAAVRGRWPEGFTFESGAEERTEDPISSLKRIVPDKEIIVLREASNVEPTS